MLPLSSWWNSGPFRSSQLELFIPSTAPEREVLSVPPSLGSERHKRSKNLCRHLGSQEAQHGDTVLTGWPPLWHEVTFPVAWCYCPSYCSTASYASHTICPFWGTRWSLIVWGSQLAPCTGHFHPAPAPWECIHHLLAFSGFDANQALDQNLFSWQIATWHINSAHSHWDLIFVSHIWRVSQAACCHQFPSDRKDRTLCIITLLSNISGGPNHHRLISPKNLPVEKSHFNSD